MTYQIHADGETHNAATSLDVATIIESMETLDQFPEGGISIEKVSPDSTETELADFVEADTGTSYQAGDIVRDGVVTWSDGDGVEVLEVTNIEAQDFHIDGPSSPTVAEKNPHYPADDVVVIGEYTSGASKQYAFPASRLEEQYDA